MNYEINVGLHGRHFFATNARSLRGIYKEQAIEMARTMAAKFPESEGFCVTMSVSTSSSQSVDFAEWEDSE